MKAVVAKEADSGLWTVEIPRITEGLVMLGWHREYFDTWREAMAFTFAGPFIVRTPRCDSICDAASGGSCFTPWCKCSCHRSAREFRLGTEPTDSGGAS